MALAIIVGTLTGIVASIPAGILVYVALVRRYGKPGSSSPTLDLSQWHGEIEADGQRYIYYVDGELVGVEEWNSSY